MSDTNELILEKEKLQQEYRELCTRLEQSQSEEEKQDIEKLIKSNMNKQRILLFQELRENLLKVEDNKERNRIIDAFVEEKKKFQ